MANQDVSLRGLFCAVLTRHGPGDMEQLHRQYLLNTKGSRGSASERCSICSFPRRSGDRKVTKGNVEGFLGQYVACPFDNFLGDYPADGKPWSSWLGSLKETKTQQRACTQFERSKLVYGKLVSRDTRRTARANRHQGVCWSSDTFPAATANNRAQTTPP